jgi:hypothetical protein
LDINKNIKKQKKLKDKRLINLTKLYDIKNINKIKNSCDSFKNIKINKAYSTKYENNKTTKQLFINTIPKITEYENIKINSTIFKDCLNKNRKLFDKTLKNEFYKNPNTKKLSKKPRTVSTTYLSSTDRLKLRNYFKKTRSSSLKILTGYLDFEVSNKIEKINKTKIKNITQMPDNYINSNYIENIQQKQKKLQTKDKFNLKLISYVNQNNPQNSDYKIHDTVNKNQISNIKYNTVLEDN